MQQEKITKQQFEKFWADKYAELLPIGHIIRNHFFHDRWFRIHSLPNSKRYADNNKEMEIILDRQNALISDLIGEQNQYLLFLSTMSDEPSENFFETVPDAIILNSIRLDTVLSEEYENEFYLHSVFINKVWLTGDLNDYLTEVANGGKTIYLDGNTDTFTCKILIIDVMKNRIIAPYDGGVDIFLATREERDTYKIKYKNWLSFTESGL